MKGGPQTKVALRNHSSLQAQCREGSIYVYVYMHICSRPPALAQGVATAPLARLPEHDWEEVEHDLVAVRLNRCWRALGLPAELQPECRAAARRPRPAEGLWCVLL